MSIDYPQTLQEWDDHISQYHGTVLLDMVRTANKMAFVQTLLDEGMVMAGINELFAIFVRRVVGLGLPIPTNGIYDLEDIARNDPVAQLGHVLEVKAPNPGGGVDEIDLMCQELDAQTDTFMEADEDND